MNLHSPLAISAPALLPSCSFTLSHCMLCYVIPCIHFLYLFSLNTHKVTALSFHPPSRCKQSLQKPDLGAELHLSNGEFRELNWLRNVFVTIWFGTF